MKCYTVDGSGLDSVRLAEREDPGAPGPGEALVEVHAVSLNYRDLMVADGRYSGRLDPPIVAASDMAGIVAAIGSGVTSLKPGDRVLNLPFRHWPAGTLRPEWARSSVGSAGVDGVLAERVVYPADSLVRLPGHMTLAEASTLPVAGLTAWAAVVTHGRTRPGDWVLLHGTGGVSVFAAQIARAIGARTILSTSSDEKARVVRQRLRVDATFDYREPDWPKKVREITGGSGADVVVETAGGASLGKSVRAAGYGARIGLIGVLAGKECVVSAIDLIYHQVSVRGILIESAEELRALARAFEANGLCPVIDRVFPFSEAPAACAYLASQEHIGKVVIEVRRGPSEP